MWLDLPPPGGGGKRSMVGCSGGLLPLARAPRRASPLEDLGFFWQMWLQGRDGLDRTVSIELALLLGVLLLWAK